MCYEKEILMKIAKEETFSFIPNYTVLRIKFTIYIRKLGKE